jgi:ATP-binding cassette, subfamily C, bacterial CydD
VLPVDRRLLRYARAARRQLVTTVALGIVTTAAILAQASLLAHALATAARGQAAAAALWGTLAALLGVVAVRVAVTYGGEVCALRAAATVKSQLRRALAARAVGLGPAWSGCTGGQGGPGGQGAEVAALATRGLDGLDPYFARYLPQLVLAAAVPVAVLARVAAADWISAVLIAATLPLIPLFAVLIGWHTKAQTRRQWRLLATLAGHFLDVVEGLPTLKLFGRAKPQQKVIGEVTGAYRSATMSALRVAFLSALVLELAAAVATALVAVEVGLRLLYGHIGYETALLVLLLTPEAFLPLRAVAAQFHASMEGAAAAGRVLEILETDSPSRPTSTPGIRAGLRTDEIILNAVTAAYPGRDRPALRGLNLAIRPGERVAVTGPSGAGKSTLLALLLGFIQPAAGTIQAGGTDLAAIDLAGWRAQIAWVPQQPHLFAGTAADNIALGSPGIGLDAIRRAAELAGAAEFIEELPRGYREELGERGLRLSAGQRQKIALARAFLRDARLLLLGFIQPAAGTIQAGGTDLAAIDLAGWRAQIAWVPQQPHLFAGTAADNIALGSPGTGLDAIRRAAELAGAAEFIEELPHGYREELGERGLRLSAGQRQKIALARAFLRDARLLLLDEPAAHLDPASARQLWETVETLAAGRTVVLVSHGRGWEGLASRVITLDHGQLRPPAAVRPSPTTAVLRPVPTEVAR